MEYWAIRSSARSFARTTHSFACSTLLALLTHSLARGKVDDSMSQNDLVLSHSGPVGASVRPSERMDTHRLGMYACIAFVA